MKDMGMTIETDMLEKWAENQARGMQVKGWAPASSVAAQTSSDVRKIELFAARVGLWAEKNRFLPQEFEWLLDNRYLILREAAETTRLLKKKDRLPADQDGVAVFSLAKALVRSGRGEITLERVEKFLRGAQKKRALLEKELWLLIPMMRAALTHMTAWLCGEMEGVLTGYRRAPERDPFAAELAIYRARESGKAPPDGAEELSKGAQAVHARLSGLMGAVVTSLRMLSVTDMSRTLQEASAVESLLGKDPAGIYPLMDEASRGRYRQRLSQLARREKIAEDAAAERILSMCRKAATQRDRHVGTYLFERPLGKKPSGVGGALYFIGMALITALISVSGALVTGAWWMGLLLLLPASDMAKNICDWAAAHLVRPRPIPRLELKDGIPDGGRTLCVISALLTDMKSVASLSKKLEYYSLANRDAGKNLSFGILGDLADASAKKLSGDKKILEEAQKQIFELNRKYGGGFYLFLRERELNVRDGRYMGWERKRGALIELMRLLRGMPTGLRVANGDASLLRDTQFVITLDSDTELTPGSARKLVGGMMHPLCRPQIDEKRNIVVKGYGIILPRMAVDLEAAGKSLFSRVYAGQGGLDPYGGMAGDVYHDLFDQGSFVGKGILDVDAVVRVLDGRFPENRILSHDLLEGSYLRAGLMGDLELSDGYPCKVTSWFDRLHRWTRGDWQIAAWIFGRVPGRSGREANPIGPLSRWKIFDNIRRSLTSPALLVLLTAGLLMPGGRWAPAAAFAVLCALSNLMLSAADMAFRGKAGRGVRYHSTIITGLRAVLLQTAFQLLFLPYNAFVSLSAALTALYRTLISHRKMLQWVTAAQSEKFTQSAVKLARKMFPAIVWGVLTACYSRSVAGWLAGVLWALSPVVAAAISRVVKEETRLPDADRAFLQRQAALMWQYFEDLLTPEDNYLPPDNWQEQPAAGIAHRTSPTNIGLALICALSAADLELCSRERALHLIDRILSTIEKLPKWHGHIYNWYDTRTLEPLRPNCVSTVDSGNLAGYLIALRQGLLGLRDAAAEDLAHRAGALADAMDFSRLYDSGRKLFVISCDMETQKQTEGYYDLLASEARLTSYLAIARGEIERENWKRLGRAMTGEDHYRGMASWTGTMFEYFMPHLVLPIYDNSLLYESLRFALHCQRARGAEQKTPWGISESCFYAFDAALNYQYKAHGVPALAYKRGVGKENVVSPYSSFLALMLQPDAAVKNLRKLRAMGLEGRYGLYEAADFTPARLSGEKRYEPVRCFMSHHIGMSIVAVCNALCGNVWQKRFLSDPAMGAYACMLQERVPVGGATVRPEGREVPEKPKRAQGEGIRREVASINPDYPRTHVLSNSSYTLVCTDGGLSASSCAGMAINRADTSAHAPGGMQFYFKSGGQTSSLLPLPVRDGPGRSRAVFEGGCASWETACEAFESTVTAWVPENENAEIRNVTIKNTSGGRLEGELLFYFEPVLQPAADFGSHPAFSKLFLETSPVHRGVMVRRRPRGGQGEKHLCCLCDSEAVVFDTSREKALGRGAEEALRNGRVENTRTFGAVLDPCLLACIPVKLEPGGGAAVRFTLAFADAERDALSAAERSLKLREAPRTGRMDGLVRTLGLTQAEASTALDMLSPLVFTVKSVPEKLSGGLRLGQQGLWKHGISGDLPIITARATDASQMEKLGRILRMHEFLSRSGVACDLVVLSREGGSYRRPVRGAIMETLKAMGCESTLGARGGVHHVDLTVLSEQEEQLLLALSRVMADKMPEDAPVPQYSPPAVLPPPPPVRHESGPYGWEEDGAFHFETGNGLPLSGWSHLLANPSFGALVTECGVGYMWRRNARENKMLPWTNDPLATRGAEEIRIRSEGREASLFAAQDGLPCRVRYGFGYAVWEKSLGGGTVKTTAFVPPDRMARVLIVEADGLKDAQICYSAGLAMGVSDAQRGCIQLFQEKDGLIRAENPYNAAFAPQVFALASSVPSEFTPGKPGWIYAKIPTVRRKGRLRAVIVTGCAQNAPGLDLIRALADDREAEETLERTLAYWAGLVNAKPVSTGNEGMDRYLNGWALYQVIACRLYARTSLYQCGGAYGFRDQLQDVCAAMYADPGLAKNQILRASVHQYEEGDGQHWWHPGQLRPGEGDKGVRTRCSDDYLWLPYTVCEYLDRTGDEGILDIRTPYISSKPLARDAHDRYETPLRTAYRESIYEHCLRAVDLAIRRGTGTHGLALMGAGDWNDGFNLVGDKGHGESVWLTWFLAHVCERMAPLCEARGDHARAESYRLWRGGLIRACEGAWDGKWFRRGYYDDGSTLGSHADEGCRIDSIAQSWSAMFADELPEGMVQSALDMAWERLVDEEHRLVRLFEPPFEKSAKNPGYIKGYVPGVRENGGQYTHAAVWLAMGCHLAGQTDRAVKILDMLLPSTHPDAEYKTEPHVLAADVYHNPAHAGRGGWSHYTGAAAWYYRVAMEVMGATERDGPGRLSAGKRQALLNR